MTKKARLALCLRPVRDFPHSTPELQCHDQENQRFNCCSRCESAVFGPTRHASVRRCAFDGEVWISDPAAASNSYCAVHAGSGRPRHHNNPIHRVVGSLSIRRNRPERACRACRNGPRQRLRRGAPSDGSGICHGACQSDPRPQAPASAYPGRHFFFEDCRPLRVARTGAHRRGAKPGGSKAVRRAVAASGAGAERAGPLPASSEIPAPAHSFARSRRWSGR
jgi:hypothetical protein